MLHSAAVDTGATLSCCEIAVFPQCIVPPQCSLGTPSHTTALATRPDETGLSLSNDLGTALQVVYNAVSDSRAETERAEGAWDAWMLVPLGIAVVAATRWWSTRSASAQPGHSAQQPARIERRRNAIDDAAAGAASPGGADGRFQTLGESIFRRSATLGYQDARQGLDGQLMELSEGPTSTPEVLRYTRAGYSMGHDAGRRDRASDGPT